MSMPPYTMNILYKSMLWFFLIMTCYDCKGQEDSPVYDVPFEPSHPKVVEAMLDLAKVTRDDLLYDLGCGDGRILIMGAKKVGVHGVGVDIDPLRIKEAQESAINSGVADNVQFILGDIFDFDFKNATVLTMYLLQDVHLRLRPIIFQQLKPGTRVVSHAFDMGVWEPDSVVHHPRARKKKLLLWIIPAPIGGDWHWTTDVTGKAIHWNFRIKQEFQDAKYNLTLPKYSVTSAGDIDLRGRELTFNTELNIETEPARINYSGTVQGDTIIGLQEWKNGQWIGTYPWVAIRKPVDMNGTWDAKTENLQVISSDFKLVLDRSHNGSVLANVVSEAGRLSNIPFYAWGASIMFEFDNSIYKGFIRDDSIIGDIGSEFPKEDSTWSAKRIF